MFLVWDYGVATIFPARFNVNWGYYIVLFDAILGSHYILLALWHALQSSCNTYDIFIHFRKLSKGYFTQLNINWTSGRRQLRDSISVELKEAGKDSLESVWDICRVSVLVLIGYFVIDNLIFMLTIGCRIDHVVYMMIKHFLKFGEFFNHLLELSTFWHFSF